MKQILFICMCVLLVTSCKKEKQCSGEVICDDMYVMIHLTILTTDGTPLELDSAVVRRIEEDGEIVFVPEHDSLYSFGSYVIATDSDKEGISFDGDQFRFAGWLDDELVVEEDFLIGRDCCHVRKLEGPDEVIVE